MITVEATGHPQKVPPSRGSGGGSRPGVHRRAGRPHAVSPEHSSSTEPTPEFDQRLASVLASLPGHSATLSRSMSAHASSAVPLAVAPPGMAAHRSVSASAAVAAPGTPDRTSPAAQISAPPLLSSTALAGLSSYTMSPLSQHTTLSSALPSAAGPSGTRPAPAQPGTMSSPASRAPARAPPTSNVGATLPAALRLGALDLLSSGQIPSPDVSGAAPPAMVDTPAALALPSTPVATGFPDMGPGPSSSALAALAAPTAAPAAHGPVPGGLAPPVPPGVPLASLPSGSLVPAQIPQPLTSTMTPSSSTTSLLLSTPPANTIAMGTPPTEPKFDAAALGIAPMLHDAATAAAALAPTPAGGPLLAPPDGVPAAPLDATHRLFPRPAQAYAPVAEQWSV